MKKYARKSLEITKKTIAREKAKNLYLTTYSKLQERNKFFSMAAQEGIDAYLKEKYNDVITGLIVERRH